MNSSGVPVKLVVNCFMTSVVQTLDSAIQGNQLSYLMESSVIYLSNTWDLVLLNQVVIVTCSSLHSLQESAVDFQEIEEALVLIKVSCPSFK